MHRDSMLEALIARGVEVDTEVTPPEWGQQRLRVFQGREKRFVLKMIPDCGLLNLPSPLCRRLFDSLHETTTSLLLPLQIDEEYIWEVDRQPLMLFPWIGDWTNTSPQWHISNKDHIRFIAGLHNELDKLPDSLVDELKANSLNIGLTQKWFGTLVGSVQNILGPEIATLCIDLMAKTNCNWASESYQMLVHTDLHSSNIMLSSDGRLIAVDIDYMRVGNGYADLIYVLSVGGADLQTIDESVRLYRANLNRAAGELDPNKAMLGTALTLDWISAVLKQIEGVLDKDQQSALTSSNCESTEAKIVLRILADRAPLLHKAYCHQIPLVRNGLRSVLEYALRC